MSRESSDRGAFVAAASAQQLEQADQSGEKRGREQRAGRPPDCRGGGGQRRQLWERRQCGAVHLHDDGREDEQPDQRAWSPEQLDHAEPRGCPECAHDSATSSLELDESCAADRACWGGSARSWS